MTQVETARARSILEKRPLIETKETYNRGRRDLRRFGYRRRQRELEGACAGGSGRCERLLQSIVVPVRQEVGSHICSCKKNKKKIKKDKKNCDCFSPSSFRYFVLYVVFYAVYTVCVCVCVCVSTYYVLCTTYMPYIRCTMHCIIFYKIGAHASHASIVRGLECLFVCDIPYTMHYIAH